MSEHTNGTWVRCRGEGSTVRCYWDSNGVEGSTYIADVHKHNPEWEANARLIAAAPDLLEACRAALELVPDNNEYDGFPETFERIRAAIAKAEGSGA